MIIKYFDIENNLKIPLSESTIKTITDSNLIYRKLTEDEKDTYILSIINYLSKTDVVSAGEHRINDWESGWGENLIEFQKTKNFDSLIPKYHGKHSIVHWSKDGTGNVVKPMIENFDYILHEIIFDIVIENYFSHVSNIVEFGCGPAYHLLKTRKFNKDAFLYGLDWATSSQDIITEISKMGIETKIYGRNFDFYKPDYTFNIPSNSGVLTIAALEQVGSNFEPFLQYLLDKKPNIVVHLEPIEEVLENGNLIDNLSVLYFKKRNYLTGYLTRLKVLEKEGKIKIRKEQRTYTGSYFIEGHTLIVWEPI